MPFRALRCAGPACSTVRALDGPGKCTRLFLLTLSPVAPAVPSSSSKLRLPQGHTAPESHHLSSTCSALVLERLSEQSTVKAAAGLLGARSVPSVTTDSSPMLPPGTRQLLSSSPLLAQKRLEPFVTAEGSDRQSRVHHGARPQPCTHTAPTVSPPTPAAGHCPSALRAGGSGTRGHAALEQDAF